MNIPAGKIGCIIVSFIMLLPSAVFSMPFRGEANLILDSGLTDNPKYASPDAKGEPRFKNLFSPGKDIIFWATVSKKKEDVMKYVQSVEWYAQDGRIWYEENKQVFASGSISFASSLEKTALFTLATKAIPKDKEGVWAVRFIWNNSVINEYYFAYSAAPIPPSADQIAALKKKMQEYQRLIAVSNKSNYYKLSSRLARDVKKLYKAQEVYRPDVVFMPDEKIIYMFNYDSTDFGLYSQVPQSNIYLFSPYGKLKKVQHNNWMYSASDPDYICGFRDTIDLKKIVDNKDLYGLWKLIVYIPSVNQNFDERYFYIGNNTSADITEEAVKTLDKKIDENEIVKSLDWVGKNDRDNAIKNGQDKTGKKRVDIGMSRDDVVKLFGQPNKILTDKYDDAVVWIYTSINKDANDPAYASSATSAVWRRADNLGTGLIAGGIVTGLTLLVPNKLEIVIKDDIVVSVKGTI